VDLGSEVERRAEVAAIEQIPVDLQRERPASGEEFGFPEPFLRRAREDSNL